MQESTLLTQSIPTKKRGIIWLISSLLLIGMAGFAAFVYWLQLVLGFAVGLKTLFLVTNPFLTNFDRNFSIFLFALSVSLLAYVGVWYGAMLITASYKKYSFTKTRLLALVISISSVAIAALILKIS